MAKTFEGTPYDPGFDQNLLAEIADYFRPLREEWIKSGLLNPKVLGVNVKTLLKTSVNHLLLHHPVRSLVLRLY